LTERIEGGELIFELALAGHGESVARRGEYPAAWGLIAALGLRIRGKCLDLLEAKKPWVAGRAEAAVPT